MPSIQSERALPRLRLRCFACCLLPRSQSLPRRMSRCLPTYSDLKRALASRSAFLPQPLKTVVRLKGFKRSPPKSAVMPYLWGTGLLANSILPETAAGSAAKERIPSLLGPPIIQPTFRLILILRPIRIPPRMR